MAKLLYLKKKDENFQNQKFVFKIEVPSTQPAPSGGSLSERIEKRYNTNLNVESKFNPDPNSVFEDLGKKAAQKNDALSPESLKKDFEDTLAADKKAEDVWPYLQDKGCETAAIVDGHLRFFAGPVGTKEIHINEFFKPLPMKIGEGTVTSEYLLKRQEIMKQNMQSLQALKGELPELPPKKTN